MKSIREASVENKKVFLRADFNVPMKDDKIVDVNRIKAVLPTIKYLLERKAILIIGTHIGRPGGKYDPQFSTIPVAQEMAKLLNKPVYATDEVVGEKNQERIATLVPGEIFLIGNLRFNPGEKENDENFAKQLSAGIDIYVNDAFAVSHRSNASVDAITKLIPSYSGLLLESEITKLKLILENPEKPFLLIIGGAKVKDKAAVLKKLAEKADTVVVGGAVANTFLASQGTDLSESLVEKEMFPVCKEIINIFSDKIILPEDFEKELLDGGKFKVGDIGPKTRQKYIHEISYAKTIFWNGNMGKSEDEKFALGTKEVAEAIVKSNARSVIAGGDTAGYINDNNLNEGISFISTGGGAALEFLAGEPMPGIEALSRNQ